MLRHHSDRSVLKSLSPRHKNHHRLAVALPQLTQRHSSQIEYWTQRDWHVVTVLPDWKRWCAATAAMAWDACCCRAAHCAAVGGIMLCPEVILSHFSSDKHPCFSRGAYFQAARKCTLGVTSASSRSKINGALGIFFFFFLCWPCLKKSPRFCLFVDHLMEDCTQAKQTLKLNCFFITAEVKQ